MTNKSYMTALFRFFVITFHQIYTTETKFLTSFLESIKT